MKQDFVLTLIGPDRPGLVDAVAKTVAEHDGNWVASRMVRLAGKFAGVLWITVPSARAAELTADLQALDASGLNLRVEPADSDAPDAVAASPEAVTTLHLEVIGHDQPGIVRQISQALVARGVNVVELETETFDAPMTGEAMFRLSAELRAKADLSVDELEEALEQVGHTVSAEITLQAPTRAT